MRKLIVRAFNISGGYGAKVQRDQRGLRTTLRPTRSAATRVVTPAQLYGKVAATGRATGLLVCSS